MTMRNGCTQTVIVAFILAMIVGLCAGLTNGLAEGSELIEYQSSYVSVAVSTQQPAFCALAVDATGQGKFAPNSLRLPKPSPVAYAVQAAGGSGSTWEYRLKTPAVSAPTWSTTTTCCWRH